MSHLTLEALARLVDEAPTAPEASHLATCEACREELAALRAQHEGLATLPSMMPPPDAWPALRDRLQDEGLVRSAETPTPGRRFPGRALRVAASVAIFLVGGAAGWAVRGAGPATPTPTADAAGDRGLAAAARPAASGAATPSAAMVAERRGVAATDDGPTVDEAQRAFLASLDRYMAASGSGSTAGDPAARLATLDNILATTAEALNEAPGDPVINSYHLTALAQREELLRQIAASAGEPVF